MLSAYRIDKSLNVLKVGGISDLLIMIQSPVDSFNGLNMTQAPSVLFRRNRRSSRMPTKNMFRSFVGLKVSLRREFQFFYRRYDAVSITSDI